MKLLTHFLLALTLTTSTSAFGETRNLQIGNNNVLLEIARTPFQHQRGLMNRPSIPENHGMLFCLNEHGNIAMWMKNTLLDLDAAFFDETGTLFHTVTMKANTENLHYALGDAHYVIEMRAGWFKKTRTLPGFRLAILPEICKKKR